ncbi:hypothetical protein ABZX40_37940 [Streptomyces sp. NPDC004610]|uniref:hypothetical protein n=1 Tax=unclassified Streptomyces TaxID=2593676 RepID=UPI0033A36417
MASGFKQAALSAVAAATLLTGTSETVGAATPQAAPAAARAKCGAPEIKVWYDRDQYGSYLKAWFKTASSCPRNRPVAAMVGEILCLAGPKKGKLVYKINTAGKTPLATDMRTLPRKNQCSRFKAFGVLAFRGTAIEFADEWLWSHGNYPA